VTHPYQELIERIRGEVPEFERVMNRALRAWPQAQKTFPEQEVYMDSVALNLHSFYAGVERLFELIARHMDRGLPGGETWHRELLKQMARDLEGVRPAVIDEETFLRLDDFRRFRHLVQNIYAINLMPDKMRGLMEALPALWSTLKAELMAFADFLEDLSNTD
jgi:hypothetical protein